MVLQARRELLTLRGLVKPQGPVRSYIMRKRTASNAEGPGLASSSPSPHPRALTFQWQCLTNLPRGEQRSAIFLQFLSSTFPPGSGTT
ncbi:hypothetical protein Nepgr_028444 [Nepenthes gracilis]|uniref:Uncharacterized protein n=1 Tax=Nepenthes gracilis TaxID=150966 RepID=A0AAD3TD26_NEPGR|nr:hypothetical protein Nepgr_028444 [Nepenthes gracilis]